MSAEVSVKTTGALSQRDSYPHIARMIDQLMIETDMPEDGFRADVASIMENIMSGQTAEEVFGNQEAGTVSGQEYVNTPFLVLNNEAIEFRKSGAGYVAEGAFPFYAFVNAVNPETGEEFKMTMGGSSAVAVLWKLRDLNYFDQERLIMFVEKPVASGFNVILVKPVATGNGKGRK